MVRGALARAPENLDLDLNLDWAHPEISTQGPHPAAYPSRAAPLPHPLTCAPAGKAGIAPPASLFRCCNQKEAAAKLPE